MDFSHVLPGEDCSICHPFHFPKHLAGARCLITNVRHEMYARINFWGTVFRSFPIWDGRMIPCTYLSWLVSSCFCYFLRWLLQPSQAYHLSICRQSRLKLPPKGVPWETKKAPLQHSWCRGDGPNGEAGTISVAGCCSIQSGARNNLSVAWIGIFAQNAKIWWF